MYWKIANLDPSLRRELERVAAQQGLPDAPCFFMRRNPMLKFLLGGLGGVAAAGLIAFVLLEEPSGHAWLRSVFWILAGGSMFWSALVFRAVARSRSSAVRPFLLITPRVLLQVDHDDGELAGFLLADAINFQAVRRASTANPEALKPGLSYKFEFDGAEIEFALTDMGQINQLDKVLALAREPKATEATNGDGVHLLPASEGSKHPLWPNQTSIREWLFEPWGLAWVIPGVVLGLILVILLLVAFVLLVSRRIFGWP